MILKKNHEWITIKGSSTLEKELSKLFVIIINKIKSWSLNEVVIKKHRYVPTLQHVDSKKNIFKTTLYSMKRHILLIVHQIQIKKICLQNAIKSLKSLKWTVS